jgi:Flp pilus assembly protein TadG
MMGRLHRERRGEGQALVEFALVIPIFLLVVLGLFDMGRAVFYFSTISNASREAVRLGIVDQNVADVRQEAVDSASGVMPITNADVDVTFLAPDLSAGGPCSTAPYDIGCVVRVEITHSFVAATPFVGALQLSTETHQPIERRFASP